VYRAAIRAGYKGAMDLPVLPPLQPMLGRLSRSLPVGQGLNYEPKWDGFRCIAFRDGMEVELWSRNQRSLTRYFPELVEGFRQLQIERVVLDGEILGFTRGNADFGALLARLHPARSRVERLRSETPACLIAFDVIAVGEQDLRAAPFSTRRTRLGDILSEPPASIVRTPWTEDPDAASEWLDHVDGAIDGVVVKRSDLPYESGRRAMTKVKPVRTADCVVAGLRTYYGEPAVASLLLGLYGDDDLLHHVGVASSFTDAQREALLRDLVPSITPLEGHAWEQGFGLAGAYTNRLAGAAGCWTPASELDWIPVRPETVCEVAYETWDGSCFRHPARFRRWRPDRDPPSCTFEQFSTGGAFGWPASLGR
jgi:ATP-dependent DNA ligase